MIGTSVTRIRATDSTAMNYALTLVTSQTSAQASIDILMHDSYLLGMRTTIRLDDDLLREAKAYAAATDRTLTRLIEDALREALARRRQRGKRPRVELPTSGGGGLQPGVDLDNSASLWDLMDGLSDPS